MNPDWVLITAAVLVVAALAYAVVREMRKAAPLDFLDEAEALDVNAFAATEVMGMATELQCAPLLMGEATNGPEIADPLAPRPEDWFDVTEIEEIMETVIAGHEQRKADKAQIENNAKAWTKRYLRREMG